MLKLVVLPRLHAATCSARPRVPSAHCSLEAVDYEFAPTMWGASTPVLSIWLQECHYDVVFLQEIHYGIGRLSTHWNSSGWRFVTTADPQTRFQGVAVLIKVSLAPEHAVQFQEVHPGRLLHVRVRLDTYALDILGVYQHAWTADSSKLVLDKRSTIWNKLSCYLGRLPVRNQLLLLGDFNCGLRQTAGVTGPALLPPQPPHPDFEATTAMAETVDLCALNTWISRQSRDMSTFRHERGSTQIDYIFTRRVHADKLAGQSLPEALRPYALAWRLEAHATGRQLACSFGMAWPSTCISQGFSAGLLQVLPGCSRSLSEYAGGRSTEHRGEAS